MHWLLKWGLVLGLGATAVGGAIVVERSVRPVDSTAMTTAVESTVTVPRNDSAAASTSSPADAEEQPAEAVVESKQVVEPMHESQPRTVRPSRDAAEAPSPGAVSIREEVRLLDRARAEMARDAPDAALATLAEYSARYPKGTLREEASVIRIDALRASGRDGAASREQQDFQQHFPASASAYQLDAGSR